MNYTIHIALSLRWQYGKFDRYFSTSSSFSFMSQKIWKINFESVLFRYLRFRNKCRIFHTVRVVHTVVKN